MFGETRMRLVLKTLLLHALIMAMLNVTVSAAAPIPSASPGANLCVLCDLGARAGDPTLPKEIGLLAKGPEGDLYTTSPAGGSHNNQGTIFRISPKNGALHVLYSFDRGEKGGNPLGGLVATADGTFTGTTYAGGLYVVDDKGTRRAGAGTVFSFRPGAAAPEVLHTFRNGNLDGIKPILCPKDRPCQHSPQQRMDAAPSYPLSAPVLASDGNLYGVTAYSNNQGFGALYRISSGGFRTLCISADMPTAPDISDEKLRDSCLFNGPNGNMPVALAAAPNGALYGTTLGGTAENLYGTVFRATLSGRVTTIHRFDLKTGARPNSVLVGADGSLYGTTQGGGTLSGGKKGYGVVYRITPAGQYSVLHTFTGLADGREPASGLIEARNENSIPFLYGSTRFGGNNRGVIFRISTTGDFEVLHRHAADLKVTGRSPASTLFELDGAFYGTTYQGGAADSGVFFRLSGVDLPMVKDLTRPITLFGGSPAATKSIPVIGQALPVKIEVRTGVVAGQPNSLPGVTDDGISIRVSNCRSPHILQFIYREKIGADGVAMSGNYSTGNLEAYPFTTDPNNPAWHTDGGAGRPNPYYDQGGGLGATPGNARILGPNSLLIWDQPSFRNTDLYPPGAHETWRASFKDYVICNCQVVAEVRWAREIPWQLAAGSETGGKQGAARYRDVTISPPTDPTLSQANKQLRMDGYATIP